MTGSSSPMPDREEQLDEAVAAYLEAVESGQHPDRGAWLARYPDLSPELGEFIDDQERLQRWTSPLRESSGAEAAGEDPQATLHVPGGFAADPLRRFPNYELLGEIARGGMGIVYRARQLNPNRIVALKMILAGPHASAAELYRFRMETEAAASLDHPNIMPIYEVGDREGRPFFSMKLMDGGTLAEHLSLYEGEGRAVATLLIKVARAVHHAHQRGILHRDLKPANILLDSQGEPHVTDFGLCRRVEVDSGMTQSGVIVGTPSYMSPEQAAGRRGLTTATDIYSLGAILYTLLTDRPPFRGDTPLETVRGVLEDEPSRPRLLRPQVDRDLETICLKCLDKQPERRYGSAEALADDLQRWLAGEPIVARRSSLWERTWKRARRNPAAAALVAVSGLALVLLIAAGVSYQNHRVNVAERRLAEANRVAKLVGDVRDHIAEAQAQLSRGDVRSAREIAIRANDQSQGESELAELAQQAQQILATTEQQMKQEQARVEATASLRGLIAHRDDVLFYGSQFAGELPANLQAARAAGAAALNEVGLTLDGQGSLRLSPWLTDDQRRDLSDACYELLLVLADVSVGEGGLQAEQALRLAERALDFGPATSAYHACLARCLAVLSRQDEAARENELAQALPATTTLDHFLRGYDFRRQGELPAAMDEFRQAIRKQPKHIWARFFQASCCLSTAPGEAEAHLTSLLDERPDLYSAYLLRGIAHANLRDDEAASDDFAQALARAPSDQQSSGFRYATLVIRGNLRTLRLQFQAAEQDLLEAVRLQPDAHAAALHLAQAYDRQGRTDEAAVQLARALEATDLTKAVKAGILLYRATRKTRDPAAAIAAQDDINLSIQLFPYAEAHVYLAEKQLRGNPLTPEDYQAVVKLCDAALASPAYSPETYRASRTHYIRAHALVELSQHQEAAVALDRFLAAGGQASAEIQRLRGVIRVAHADYPAAIQLFREALALEPGNPSTLAERGSVYLAIGALNLAADDFQEALARDPENASAYAGRGLIRATQGDAEGAEQDAERAWQYRPSTQRIAWMAARTLAISFGHLDARGRFVSVLEGKNKVRFRDRAVTLLERALALTPPDEQAAFWREAVQADAWLRLLQDHPRYRDLKQKFATTAAEPASGAVTRGEIPK